MAGRKNVSVGTPWVMASHGRRHARPLSVSWVSGGLRLITWVCHCPWWPCCLWVMACLAVVGWGTGTRICLASRSNFQMHSIASRKDFSTAHLRRHHGLGQQGSAINGSRRPWQGRRPRQTTQHQPWRPRVMGGIAGVGWGIWAGSSSCVIKLFPDALPPEHHLRWANASSKARHLLEPSLLPHPTPGMPRPGPCILRPSITHGSQSDLAWLHACPCRIHLAVDRTRCCGRRGSSMDVP